MISNEMLKINITRSRNIKLGGDGSGMVYDMIGSVGND